MFALISATLLAIALSAKWGSGASLDALGILRLLPNIGHLFAYGWAALFAAAAVGCWAKAASLGG